MKLIVCIYALALTALTSCVLSSPRIEFDKTKIDIGKVTSGTEQTAVFNLKNTGDETLELKNLRLSCGSCTTLETKSKSVPPGGSTQLIVKFLVSGNVDKRIYVTSSDPAKPTTTLQVIGKGEPFATVEPKYVKFDDLKIGQAAEATVLITPLSDEKKGFSVRSIKSDGNVVTASASKPDRKTGTIAVKVKVKAPEKSGRVYEKLTITTSLPGNPVLIVFVYGMIAR